MGFFRQEYWSGYVLLQRILLTQGSNSHLLHWQVDSFDWATKEALVRTIKTFQTPTPIFRTQTAASNRCWGLGEGCIDGQESKEGRVHTESVKIKTETSVKIPWAHRTSPIIQSSVQLVFWDQPHLGYFLFMPLETISKTSQGWYEATMTKSPTI